MLHPLLEKYIPSRSYVRYLQETGALFTEFETAAILSQLGLPTEEEAAVCRELLGEVADEELRRQLSEELARIERTIKLFRTGGAGAAYITGEDAPRGDMLGIAANYETARELGVHSGKGFTIRKYHLMTEYPSRPVLRKGYLNPALSDSGDWSDLVKTYEDTDYSQEIGRFTFRKDGTLLYAWSGEEEELLSDDEMLRRCFSAGQFTETYVDYPNPFEQGDLVTFARRCGEPEPERIGIVRTSRAEWEAFRQQVKNGLYVDRFDASLTVEWLTEDGRFSHDHHPPVFLERYELEKSDPRYEAIEAARSLLRGKGSLEWFGVCMEDYRKRLREGKDTGG